MFLTNLIEWYYLFMEASMFCRGSLWAHTTDFVVADVIGSVFVAAVCVLLVLRPSMSVVGTAFSLTVIVACYSASRKLRFTTDPIDDVFLTIAVIAAIVLGFFIIHLLVGRRATQESPSR